jgi:hypothetical protein
VASWEDFREIIVLDSEFRGRPGDRPEPVAMVFRMLREDKVVPLFSDRLQALEEWPLPDGDDVLYVAFSAPAEWNVLLALGRPLPRNVIDLLPEFRLEVNWALSKPLRESLLPYGTGLVGAMAHHGLPFMSVSEKKAEISLILRGGPWSPAERDRILAYCGMDVDGTALLFDRMRPGIDLERALVRGWQTKAIAQIEHNGIPVDVPMFDHLRAHLDRLAAQSIATFDRFGFYEDGHLRERRFEDWLVRQGYRSWPRTATGKAARDKETLDRMADIHPDVGPFRDLQKALDEFRALRELPIGRDGRNRCSLQPFSTSTGRFAPAGSEFIFSSAAWCRGLIRPAPGRAIAYLDYHAQEFAIAAYLSGDPAMIRDYESGQDPYLEYGRRIDFVPADATPEKLRILRKILKEAVLGTQYGQGALSLARKIGWPEHRARHLLVETRRTYPYRERWLEGAVDHAMAFGRLHTCFGWAVITHPQTRVTTLMNWPIQSHAAEMLRWACALAIARGIMVNCPVHDALLVEGPIEDIDDIVAAAIRAMEDASAIVLGGPRLKVDAKMIRWPDRFQDEDGWETWCKILGMIGPLPTAK